MKPTLRTDRFILFKFGPRSLKALSALLCLMTLLQTPGAADIPTLRTEWPPTAFQENLKRLHADPESLLVSTKAGSVSETFKGESGRLVIHIQDAHTNLGAQKNLARLLDEIIAQYGVDLIFVEGGTGNDSLSFLRGYAPAEVRKRTAMRFLEKGEISGEEYLDIISEESKPFLLWGIEDPALYEKSLITYSRIIEIRRAANMYLDRVARGIETLKPLLYPREYLDLERSALEFRKTKLSFTGYYDILVREAAANAIDTGTLPNFTRLAEIRRTESGVDFEKAGLEQTQVLKEISRTEPVFAELVQEVAAMRFGRTPTRMFAESLKTRIADHKIDMGTYPNFARYVEYVEQFSSFDMRELLKEIESLEEAIAAKRLKDPSAIRLRGTTKYLDILRNYFSLKLKPSEFATYKKNAAEFKTPEWLGFLNKQLVAAGRHGEAIPFDPVLDDKQSEVEGFYRTVEERDQAFVDRAFNKMDETGRSVSVLICGGYHTPHLKNLIKDRGASYIVITPYVNEETDIDNYERILLSSLDPTKRWLVSAKTGAIRPKAARERVLPRLRAELFKVGFDAAGTNGGALLDRISAGEQGLPAVQRFNFGTPAVNLITFGMEEGKAVGWALVPAQRGPALRNLTDPENKFITGRTQAVTPAAVVTAPEAVQAPVAETVRTAEEPAVAGVAGARAPSLEAAALERAVTDVLNVAVDSDADRASGRADTYFFNTAAGTSLQVRAVVTKLQDGNTLVEVFTAQEGMEPNLQRKVTIGRDAVHTRLEALRVERAKTDIARSSPAPSLVLTGTTSDTSAIVAGKVKTATREYQMAYRTVDRALDAAPVKGDLPAYVRMPLEAMSRLGESDPAYFKDAARLFLMEAVYAAAQRYGKNTFFTAGDADPALLTRLETVVDGMRAEFKDKPKILEALEAVVAQLRVRAPDGAQVVNLFDTSELSADPARRAAGSVNVPVDFGIAALAKGEKQVALPPLRALIRLGVYTAREQMTREDPRMDDRILNGWQALYGSEQNLRDGNVQKSFLQVLTGTLENLELIGRFAVPPASKIDLDAVIDTFDTMVRMVSKSA